MIKPFYDYIGIYWSFMIDEDDEYFWVYPKLCTIAITSLKKIRCPDVLLRDTSYGAITLIHSGVPKRLW